MHSYEGLRKRRPWQSHLCRQFKGSRLENRVAIAGLLADSDLGLAARRGQGGIRGR